MLRLGKLEPFPSAAVDAAFGHPDWQVRWGAVRARAQAQGLSGTEELARIVALSKGKPRLGALFVAAHLAARDRRSISALWEGSQWAGQADQQLAGARAPLIALLEVQLYGDDSVLRQESLTALSHLRQVAPARAILDAMSSRDRDTDPIAAAALLGAAEGRKGVGHQLLAVGRTPKDQTLIDSLLAIFSKAIDGFRARLDAAAPEERQRLAETLGAYSPLADRELETLLSDRSPQVRTAAARALAAGAGKTLLALSGEKGAAPVRARLIEALFGCEDDACVGFLRKTAEDADQPGEVRAAAIGALGGSAGKLLGLEALIRSKEPAIRAAALRALPPQLPGRASRCDWVEAALDDPEPEVLAAAVAVSVATCGPALLSEVSGYHDSPVEAVRAAAVTVLADFGDRPEARLLAARLRTDPAPDIRAEAVRGLARIGGPEAASALAEASRRDPHSRVKHLARQSLRQIGFQR